VAETNNIFIGWSGDYSKEAAKALKKWLRITVHAAKPWMSDESIEAGAQWLEEADRALSLKFGIICLTHHNLAAPWIHFEAGALSKALQQKTRVCPYLLAGLEKKDVEQPLNRFQMVKADKEGTFHLIRSINANVSPEPLSDDELQTLFEERWPKLKSELDAIPTPTGTRPAQPPTTDPATKALELLRDLAPAIQDIAAETDIARRERVAVQQLRNVAAHSPNVSAITSGSFNALAQPPGLNSVRYVSLHDFVDSDPRFRKDSARSGAPTTANITAEERANALSDASAGGTAQSGEIPAPPLPPKRTRAVSIGNADKSSGRKPKQ
jgi:hypothetical protein